MRDLSQIGTSKTLNWRAFGPGILMASAAIGGSHLISLWLAACHHDYFGERI